MKQLTRTASVFLGRGESPYYLTKDPGRSPILSSSGLSGYPRTDGNIKHSTKLGKPPELYGQLVLRIRTTDSADDPALVQEASARGLGIGHRGSDVRMFYAVWVRIDLPAQDPEAPVKILAAVNKLNAFAAEVFRQKEQRTQLPSEQQLREPPRIELVRAFDRQPLVEPAQ